MIITATARFPPLVFKDEGAGYQGAALAQGAAALCVVILVVVTEGVGHYGPGRGGQGGAHGIRSNHFTHVTTVGRQVPNMAKLSDGSWDTILSQGETMTS